MTKEEILEDINIGDIAQIYTESDEVFEGEVVDFGASGLKINLLGSNKAKRIIYSRIIEYEIEDGTSAVSEDTGKATDRLESSDEIGSSTEKDVGIDIDISVKPEEKASIREAVFSVDRNALFSDAIDQEDISEIRKMLSKRIDAKHRKEASRVLNMLEYAQKVHEYSLENDRVRRIIAEYTQMGTYDRGFFSLIAVIYQEFGEIRHAEEFYHKGGAYDREFILSYKHKSDTELFEIAVLATEYNEESSYVVKWLCEYAVNHDNYSAMLFALSNSTKYAGDILLYWYAGKEVIKELPNKTDLRSEENIDYLKKMTAEDEVRDASISDIISSVADQEVETIEEDIEEEETFKGIVSYYKKDGGYGTIKNLNGGQIYFYIKQVKDLELQKILATEINYKRRVTYIRGINFKGEVAADAIELDTDYLEESAEDEYSYEGFLEDYDVYETHGKIRSGNKLFNFIFDQIKDPFLYAEIMSRPYSVLDLEVRFNASDYKSKRTNKKSKIAVDIIGKKEYSQQEIDSFISQRLITKKEVDEWLGVSEEKSTGVFRPVAYEPLDPIGTVKEEVAVNVTPALNRTVIVTKSRNQREGEEKAVELLLPKNMPNPFLALTKDLSRKKYFQEAHRYMIGYKSTNGETVGVDLDKSEDLFIKAIQSMDQTGSSVANLVNIYIKKGGEYIVKGLQLLEVYGYLFPPEKLTNLRMQLIDKSGNNGALEKMLLSAIPNCSKSNTVWQYMAKLAGIYYKQQKWDLAIQWFEKSLDYLDKHKSVFPQYQHLRNGNLRPLIIAKYNGGDKDYAIKQAKLFLVNNPEDPVIKSIVEGTFGLDETNSVIEDFDEMGLQYEDELLTEEGDFSKYLTAKLQDVDLSSTFNKVNDVYSKTQDGVFVGNSDDVKRAIDYITNSIIRRGKTVSAEYRSSIYIGVARIILDSRNNKENDSDTKVSVDELSKYVGRYARYTADAFVEKYATIDSIRYMYILALKNLVKQDTIEITAATNMLIASFFTEGRTLTDELHEMKPKVYNDSYYEQDCVSIKDFLIATFMLQKKQEYVNSILNKVYSTPKLRELCRTSLERMCGQGKDISTFYDFEGAWKTAQSRYYTIIEQIGKEIAESVDEYHMVESIGQHVSRIEELMSAKVLWNQDESVLKSYIGILLSIGNTFGKYTVEEKIDGFRLVESEIYKLKKEIENSPTELTYDYIYIRLDDLNYAIRGQFDEVYQSSRPECDIFLSNNSVYVNEKTAKIAITFKNSPDKQDADAVEIELLGSEGATFVRCEKKFTSIRSGEAQDYIAIFNLDDKVISYGQFEVTITLKYQYKESVETIKMFETTEILPVNITDKDNFVPIENKYNRIIRGSGVDVKTPELFKGRNELIDSICASLSSVDGIMTKNRGIILWGQRRVGKNSVKDYLKEKIKTEYPDAYIVIELGSIGKCRNLREVLITIINKTEDTLMTEYEDIYTELIDMGMVFDGYALEKTDNYMPEFSRFMDRLSTRLKKISDSEKNIPLFFLDEFSYLYEWIEKGEIDGKEFMRFWKSFIQDYGICSIIIAQDNIPVWKSRYENEFACMNHDNEITYLDFEGANALICEPCQMEGKSLFAPEAVKLIYEWTKGSAYLIVIFCKHVIDYLNDNYTEKATKTIVQLVFEREFLDKKEMFKSDDFEPQIQDVANVGDEGEKINKLNEKLLKEIAAATLSSSQVKIDDLRFFDECEDRMLATKVFDRLRDRKIIEVERDTYCSINMPLLKLYLLREQSLLNRDVLNKIAR